MSMRPRAAWLFLALAAAGCSTASDASKPPAQVSVPLANDVAKRLILPFDEYILSTYEVHTVESAEDVLVRDCMRDQRKQWSYLPRPSRRVLDPPNRRRYGVIESGVADRFGYHLPPERPEVSRRSDAWDARSKLPRDVQLAAYGADGVSGCWEGAHESLLRNVPTVDDSLLNKWIKKDFDKAMRHPDVVRALGKWSRCMKEEGFAYPDPLSAAEDPAWSKTDRPSRRELSVAKADVQCKTKVNLVSAWSRVETTLQREAIRRHPDHFNKLKLVKERHLDAARKILG
ncbi:hypothetical protein U9R90_23195 [Streptomyces sp. E11-3]|uniref:hypothetical protein n=1 Tax=Streptomyces sp. E11-3 TaxID=3110112 RepID=UPI0039801B00